MAARYMFITEPVFNERSSVYRVNVSAIVKFEIRGTIFSLVMFTIDEHAVIFSFDESETGLLINALLDDLLEFIKNSEEETYHFAKKIQEIANNSKLENTYLNYEIRRAKVIVKQKVN